MSQDIKINVQSVVKLLSEGFTDTDLNHDDEPMTAFDYLQDALDIEYIVSSDRKTYLGARVLVAFGGPNIWINTRTKTVEGHWWADSYSEAYTDSIGLDEALEELFNC
jgi:hypothetical protein